MIYKYFFKYPACPQCGAPIYNPAKVKIDAQNKRYICGGWEDCHIFNKELPWKINLNPAENAYIEWITAGISGIHAVNWPFPNRPLFLAVAADTISHILDRNVLLITMSDKPTENVLEETSVHEILSGLYRVTGDRVNKQSQGISKKDIFPIIRNAWEYNIDGIIKGKIPVKSFWKDIADNYGVTRERLNLRKIPNGSRFGTINCYNVMDYSEFYSSSSSTVRELVTVIKYISQESVLNYIRERDPAIVIIDAGSNTDILEFLLKDYCIPVVAFTDYDMNTVKKLINNGIKFHPLKSTEFMNAYSLICHAGNLYRSRKFNIEYIEYSTRNIIIPGSLHIDNEMVERLRRIELKSILTLRDISNITVRNDNISKLIDDVYSLSRDAGDIFRKIIEDKFGSGLNINPWRNEFINIIKERKMNENWAIMAGKFLDSYLKSEGITLHTLLPADVAGLRTKGIMIPGIYGNFNFSTLNTEKILVCGTSELLEYARYYIKNSKCQKFYRPFVEYTGDMPRLIRAVIDSINYNEFKEYSKYGSDDIDYYTEIHPIEDKIRNTIKSGDEAVYIYGIDGRYTIIPAGVEIYVIRGRSIESIRLSEKNIYKLPGTYILFDRSGLYRSIHLELLQFILNSGDIETVRVGGRSVSIIDIFNKSRMWIHGLSKLSRIISAENIASDLKNLELSAENESYLKRWWVPIETRDDTVSLYIADSPKTLNDMIRIFGYLKDKLGDESFSNNAAVECYNDVSIMHRLSRNILHGEYIDLSRKFFNLINGATDNARLLIKRATLEKVNNDTDAYTINYPEGMGAE
ncbi:MAG: hypothetical protein RE471_06060 [Ferroplasma sp.]|uniref:hypothetical protein n=1 Tax=Ferroplasma sp. TaxID=2591003 RepID=UPI0028152DBC|nr:hypothetical protein [Ferroplasma sp.]WMT50545.1 MAG: hypothetical protein RE471_06060 [Ferroplasma sp.]